MLFESLKKSKLMYCILIIFIPICILLSIVPKIKRNIKGGYNNNKQRENKKSLLNCQVNNIPFIKSNNLLHNNYYTFVIRDNRIINFPKIRPYYWQTKKGLNCLEVIEPEKDTGIKKLYKEIISKKNISKNAYVNAVIKYWGIPIILDITKYNGKDVKHLDFKTRLQYIKDFCKETKLESPNYVLFDHNKNFGTQFKKMFDKKDETSSLDNIKVILFKDPTKRYFHPKESLKWISPYILEIIGIKNNYNIEFPKRSFNKSSDKMISLYNNEFPLSELKYSKLQNGNIRIYMKKNTPTIENIESKDKNLEVTTFNNAKEIWIQMNKGVNLDDFLGTTISIMKKIHRKNTDNKLFERIKDYSTLLDIGAGRGADIMMWKRKKLKIYAVEPYKLFYDKLIKKKKIYNINTLNTGGEDYEKIINFIPGKNTIDYIIMNYSLTFFFKDEKMLNKLILIINDALKNGGKFMGVVMDGDKLLDWAKRDGVTKDDYSEIDCYPFTIKIYDKKSEDSNISRKVYINIDDKVTLVKDQWEYLVDFNFLKDKLERSGIQLIKTGFMDENVNVLNNCPKWFSELSRYFIFEKNDI